MSGQTAAHKTLWPPKETDREVSRSVNHRDAPYQGLSTSVNDAPPVEEKNGVPGKSARESAGCGMETPGTFLPNMPPMGKDHPITPVEAVMKSIDSCPGM
uniref:Uncharacterized protein n=1 Tax=Desulfacinum infernum TaxID=35837 RepID=A0A832A5N2_9BACT